MDDKKIIHSLRVCATGCADCCDECDMTQAMDCSQNLMHMAAERLEEYKAVGTANYCKELLRLARKVKAHGGIDRLADLDVAEREGKMPVLPCKVGDLVYGVRPYRGHLHVARAPVTEMYFTQDMRLHIVVKHVCRGEFGKEVFLSHEDAERALAERRGR